MIETDCQGYLKCFTEDPYGISGKVVEAAKFFRKAAEAGEDISAYAGDLKEVFLKGNNLNVMVPILFLDRQRFQLCSPCPEGPPKSHSISRHRE